MLVDKIRALFRPTEQPRGKEPADSPPVDPLHLAACALLLEIAHADGEFSAPEREHLERVLERHFALPGQAGQRLIELAEQERSRAIDHFRFTSVLRSGYDLAQKMVLAEVMWGLVLADGTISEHETYLARKIANLLELEPGYLSQAKVAAQQAAERSGTQD